MILNYVNFTDGKQLRKQLMLPELLSMLKNLVEFAPAGAKKVPSFSSATCAAKKILLGLQTCAPSASADSACAAVRPQISLSKK